MEEYTMPGTGTIQDVLVAQVTIDTDASGTGLSLALTRPFQVYDAVALPTSHVEGGTLRVFRTRGGGSLNITNAIPFASAGLPDATVSRATQISHPAITLLTTDLLTFITINATDTGFVSVYLRPPTDTIQTLTP